MMLVGSGINEWSGEYLANAKGDKFQFGLNRGRGVKIVAVLPQSVAEAQQYLYGAGLHVDAIRQASLREIGVRGTPTMLLVNSGGVITMVWPGELQPEEQDKVLTALKKG